MHNHNHNHNWNNGFHGYFLTRPYVLPTPVPVDNSKNILMGLAGIVLILVVFYLFVKK
jgi:hypothetical protein